MTKKQTSFLLCISLIVSLMVFAPMSTVLADPFQTQGGVSSFDDSEIATGDYLDVICPSGYNAYDSPKFSTFCRKRLTRYICHPSKSVMFMEVELHPTTQRFYNWRCLQYIEGLPSGNSILCPENYKRSSVRRTNCYRITRLTAYSRWLYHAPTACEIDGYDQSMCFFPEAASKKWIPTVPILERSQCIQTDIDGRDVVGVSSLIDRFDAMCFGADSEGITMRVDSSYRTYAYQQELYDRYGPGIALPPDQSKHVTGQAIDITSGSLPWLHEIVGCKNMRSGKFTMLSSSIPHTTYYRTCGNYDHVYPVKRSQLYGLSPLCEDLTTDVAWNRIDVIRCEGNQSNGLMFETWHFEIDDTFKIY
tara:strand:- start:771 stop:1856 length:1086 start_codon:yes stop_codon:yes gene_type:complete